MKPAITLTIRKRSSGYKIAALACDSLDHAHAIALIIVRSPEYQRCYVVATSWTGDEVFTVGAAITPAIPSPPAYAPAPHPHALPNARPYAQWTARTDAYAPEVIEAEPVSYAAPQQLPPRRW